jgi:excisionase family DNA binding protein
MENGMKLLTVDEVAQILRVPKLNVYRLVREGRLPAVRIGRFVRVPENELRAWIARGGAPLGSSEALPAEAPNFRHISA